MLIINGCVRLGTEGLFFKRALDKFSECQYNMSFRVQKWPDISNGWSDIPNEKEANKKGGEKNDGGENRKKKERKKRKKKRRSQQNKRKEREKEGGGKKIE